MLISHLLLKLAILSFSFFLSASAFGAGTIAALSAIKGINFRHGDIEETLLSLAIARCVSGLESAPSSSGDGGAGADALFTDLETKRVYFGNWLRDYSQAIDVGALKYVGADAMRMLIWLLGFLAFGRGTDGFEVTRERLGCYQPTEHIDNPRGYANGEDARAYDPRLRPPVNEEVELAIDGRTGLKNYISTEDAGIPNSATTLRDILTQSIVRGRQYAITKKPSDLNEALRLLGSGLHVLEDFAAHSNYVELSLIELGEDGVFPFVGRNTSINIPGTGDADVYPIVTGTYGAKDFLHSVLGELTDWAAQVKMKSLEVEEEQPWRQRVESASTSHLFSLFQRFPGQLDGEGEEEKMEQFEEQRLRASAEYHDVSPTDYARWEKFLIQAKETIIPIMEWNDHIRQQTRDLTSRFALSPDTVDSIRLEITSFILSVLSPWILPIMKHVRSGLEAASREIIQRDKEQQLKVFFDDDATDPTHSMLAKDHFGNALNEPAGRVARVIVAWTVPQIMQAWDDPDLNVTRSLNRIIYGVFHHPALRDYDQDGAGKVRRGMFRAVRRWWEEKDEPYKMELRRVLSREGVLNGGQHEDHHDGFLTNPEETLAVVDGNVEQDEVLVEAPHPTDKFRPNEFAISAVAGPEPASAQQESGYLPFYAHPDYEQSVDDQYDYESLMYNRESQEAASRERFTNEPKFEPERRSLHDGATELKITTALDFTMPESQPVPRSAPPHSIMEEALASGKDPSRFNAPREDTTGTSSEILPPIPPKVPYGAHEGESRPSFKPFDPTLDYQGPSRSQP